MPFIKGGGMYAATDKKLNMGDPVILSVHIVSLAKKFAITGTVVWISPQLALGAQGVGVQFTGNTKDNVRTALESVLGELAKKPSIYHTY